MRIQKLLIANRGEIACRIARTARRLGIATASVYTETDRAALHVRSCDEAVLVPDYLDIAGIIEAAKRVQADAIHPGYGFLAENADFAEACESAHLTFVGPRPETIRRMGSKAAAREIAASRGVPIVPGYQGLQLEHGAEVVGYPLILKASAGGGGRGMRVVEREQDFASAVEAASREALKAFGDSTLILERYIPYAHHVEVQIFGDSQGRVIHLFERDCSIQRRHQKIIEESPSPSINDVTRNRLFEAAVAIGEAVRYLNAGTVEFLVAPTGEFYFIEVNTRIQVEHPVTEMITGLDLIGMQLAVAEGRPLDEFPLVLEPMGHAIEVRLCAEDPFSKFAPSTGEIAVWNVEADRVDAGVAARSTVSRHFDSLLAKVIVHRDSREAARREMIRRLRACRVLGVATNRDYLIQLLESAEFAEGRAHTAFLPEPVAPPREAIEASATVLASWILAHETGERRILPRVGSFHNNPWRTPPMQLRWRDQLIEALPSARWLDDSLAELDGITRAYQIARNHDQYLVSSQLGSFVLERVDRHPRPASAGSNASANSPMPGQVLRILVETGQAVQSGDPLVVLEAMKMEQTIRSQMDGIVSAILVKPGEVVAPGQTLVQIGKGAT